MAKGNRHFTKEDHKWQTSTESDIQYHQPLGKLKLQEETTAEGKTKITQPNTRKPVEKQLYIYTDDRNHHCRKMVWQFLIKLNVQLPQDPGIALMGIYHRKNSSLKSCTEGCLGGSIG